jgi:HAD superfamily hydrolase (TIGR01549 family)
VKILSPCSKQPNETLFKGVKAIVFDLDGTLYDNRKLPIRLIMACPWDTYRIFSERVTRKQLRGCDYGSSEAYYEAFFSLLAKKCHKSTASMRNWYFNRYIPRMCRVFRKYYKTYPGVQDLFDALEQASVRFAIYSDYPQIEKRLKALDLAPERCGNLYCPEYFGAQKPSARPFQTIIRELGSTWGETIMVGDRDDTDGAGARASGMRFIRIVPQKKGRPASDDQIPGMLWPEFCRELLRYIEQMQYTLNLVNRDRGYS